MYSYNTFNQGGGNGGRKKEATEISSQVGKKGDVRDRRRRGRVPAVFVAHGREEKKKRV